MAPSKSVKKRKQAQRRQQAQEQQVNAVADARRADARTRSETDDIVSTAMPAAIAATSDDDEDAEDGVVLGLTRARAGAINWVIAVVVVLALVAMAYWLLTRTPT